MTPKLQRARLTGQIIPGVANDDPDPGALARILVEDQQLSLTIPIDQQGQLARLVTPSNAPVPDYAANLHFFNQVFGPTPNPIVDVNQQPRVIRRIDLSADTPGAAVACCTVVLQRMSWLVRLNSVWDAEIDVTAKPGDWLDLSFMDPLGDYVDTKLGLLMDIGVIADLPAGVMLNVFDRVPVSQVLANANVPIDPSAGEHKYCWLCGPAAPTGVPNHAHLNPGVGALGGGVAFACWAPSTEGEAQALGYRDLGG